MTMQEVLMRVKVALVWPRLLDSVSNCSSALDSYQMFAAR